MGALIGKLLLQAARNPRTRKILIRAGLWGSAIAALLALSAFLMFTVVLGAFFPGSSPSQAPSTACIAAASTQQATGQWSAEQVTNAATIVRTGAADHVPEYGLVIAVAGAMQESRLINLNHGDRDSLGLFQQRPTEGWGTPAQIMDPVYASNQFYKALLQVPGWQSRPLTADAQDVQHSGNPGAYAQWQLAATALVSHLAGVTLTAAGPAPSGACSAGLVAQRSPQALAAVLAYAYSALGTQYQFGGTCTDPHSADVLLHCDCSSLVQQSFGRAGLSLPRTAEDQWAWGEGGHAEVIPLSQAQAGDVVYFPSYLGANTIGHTGIVVDPKKLIMLDAYDTGQPVEFNSYNPSGLPYGSHMLTVLRFISTGGAGVTS